MSEGVKGYVIIRTRDHKNNGYETCDYVSEEDAEIKYQEAVASLVFPQELICRKATIKDDPCGRYYMERR